jgi:hypothetical protein
MIRRCLFAFAFINLLTLFAIAQDGTPAPSRQWRQIASLPPGSQLLVRQVGARVPQPCTLAWIDNTALACDIFVPASGPRRVVYPMASVVSVTQQATHPDNHLVALGVGMAIGGTVTGVLASEGGVRAGFAGAALGSAVGGALALGAMKTFSPSPQPLVAFRVPLRAPRLPLGIRHF